MVEPSPGSAVENQIGTLSSTGLSFASVLPAKAPKHTTNPKVISMTQAIRFIFFSVWV
jgi:hypothetical protein